MKEYENTWIIRFFGVVLIFLLILIALGASAQTPMQKQIESYYKSPPTAKQIDNHYNKRKYKGIIVIKTERKNGRKVRRVTWKRKKPTLKTKIKLLFK